MNTMCCVLHMLLQFLGDTQASSDLQAQQPIQQHGHAASKHGDTYSQGASSASSNRLSEAGGLEDAVSVLLLKALAVHSISSKGLKVALPTAAASIYRMVGIPQ